MNTESVFTGKVVHSKEMIDALEALELRKLIGIDSEILPVYIKKYLLRIELLCGKFVIAALFFVLLNYD